MRYIVVFFLLLFLIGASSATLSDYQYRQLHTIGGSTSWSGSQTNYQVKFSIFNTSGTSSGENVYTNGHSNPLWSDLRFTNQSDDNLFDYWIESTNATAAVVWVKVPNIPNTAGGSSIYIYYGNSAATNVSNGTNTFAFFDGFDNGTTLDTSKWNVPGGTVSVSSSIATVYNAGVASYLNSTNSVGSNNIALRSKIKVTNSYYIGHRFNIDDSNFIGYIGGDTSPTQAFWTNAVTATKSSFTPTYDYQIFEDRLYLPTNASFYVDNSLIGTHTTTLPSGNFRIYTYTSATKYLYLDWVLVRKYLPTEPSHSTYTSEEQLLFDRDWLVGYNYRVTHDIQGSSSWTSNQTNYPVKIVLWNITGTSTGDGCYLGSGKTQTDWDDIRFTDYSNTIVYDHWIEKTEANSATVWVELPSIWNSTGATKMNIYYGNSSAINRENGESVFSLFDHFTSSSLDLNKWNTSGTGTNTISNSILSVAQTSSGWSGVSSKATYLATPQAYELMTYAKYDSYSVFGFSDKQDFYTDASVICRVEYVGSVFVRTGTDVDSGQANNIAATTELSNYHRDAFKWQAYTTAQAVFTRDGSTLGTSTTYVPNGALLNVRASANYVSSTASTLRIDWIALRKTVTTEPTHGNYYPEEQWRIVPAQFTYHQNYTLIYNTSWTSNLTRYQLKLNIFNTSGTSSGSTVYTNAHTNATWADLRFTDSLGNLQSYWIESTNATSAVVWVEHSFVENYTNSTWSVYYGNSSAPSYQSGDNTFPLWDGFDGASIYTGKWITTGSPTISGSIVTIASTGSNVLIVSNQLFGQNYAMRAYCKSAHLGSTTYMENVEFQQPGYLATFLSYTSATYAGKHATYSDDFQLSSITGVTSNTYFILDQIRNGTTNVIFKINDANTIIHSTKIPTVTYGIRFVAQENGASVSSDWIMVRKYTSPEPTPTSWTSEPTAPTASFTPSATSGTSPLNITFTDTSTGSPTSWYWNFGDGNTSTSQNPYNVYSTAGTFNVSFGVTNAFGTSWLNTTQIVVSSGGNGETPSASSCTWHDLNLTYRLLHNLTGSSTWGGSLTGYPVKFVLWNTTSSNSGENVYLGTKVQADWSDIRFYTTTGSSMPYWIESTNATSAVVWVNMTTLTTGTNQAYLYYGKATGKTVISASNGTNTFSLFDHFDDATLSASRWGTSASITPTISGSAVTVPNTVGSDVRGIYSTTSFGYNYSIHGKQKAESSVASTYPQIGFRDLPSTTAYNNSVGYYNNGGYFSLQTQGAGSATNNATTLASDTNYHIYDIYRLPTINILSVDGYTSSSTTNLPTINLPACIIEQNKNNNAVCDYIFVRPYRAIEPSHSTWYSEETYSSCCWYNSSFSKRKPVYITNPAPVAYYQHSINVTYDSDMQSDFDDIRFYDTNGNSLPYWVESKTDESYANAWINVTYAGMPYLWMYYGNGSVVNESDGGRVFDFFDDFSSLDAGKWTTGSGSPSVSGSVVTLPGEAQIYPTTFTPTFQSYAARSFLKYTSNSKTFAFEYYGTGSLYTGFESQWLVAGKLYSLTQSGNTASDKTTSDLGTSYVNTYHIYEFKSSSTSKEIFSIDNNIVATHTTTIPSGNVAKVNLYAESGQTLYIDWIAIHKYTLIEPTLSKGTEESTPSISASFTTDPTSGYAPLLVNFTDTSTGSPTTWSWDFGEGNTSSSQNPNFTYTLTGNYTVTLNASTSCAYGTATTNITVLGTVPTTEPTTVPTTTVPTTTVPTTTVPTTAPTSVPTGGSLTNTSVQNRLYTLEDFAIPFELWVLIIILGFVFFSVSVLSDRAIIPLAMLAFMCFLASAYAAPTVGFFSYDTVVSGTTLNVVPYVQFVNQPWVMWLLYGFALIAMLNVWRGVLYQLQQIRERKLQDI